MLLALLPVIERYNYFYQLAVKYDAECAVARARGLPEPENKFKKWLFSMGGSGNQATQEAPEEIELPTLPRPTYQASRRLPIDEQDVPGPSSARTGN